MVTELYEFPCDWPECNRVAQWDTNGLLRVLVTKCHKVCRVHAVMFRKTPFWELRRIFKNAY